MYTSTIKRSFIQANPVSIANRMEKALEHAGLTKAELARRLEVTPQAVNGWFKTGTISKPKLVQFAVATGVTLEWLMTEPGPGDEDAEIGWVALGAIGRGATLAEATRVMDDARSADLYVGSATIRDIPVVGHAIANPIEDGYFDDMGLPQGIGDGYVPWATKDVNAYGVRVKGDSMQPRFRAGEIVIVEPGAAVIPGDDVIVRTRDGRKMVKRLLFQRGRELALGSINDRHPTLTISLDEIESMHHIAGSVQRGTSTKD